ncbi:Transposon TX1 putative 149 kDa protein-like protein [Drosera capensis]
MKKWVKKLISPAEQQVINVLDLKPFESDSKKAAKGLVPGEGSVQNDFVLVDGKKAAKGATSTPELVLVSGTCFRSLIDAVDAHLITQVGTRRGAWNVRGLNRPEKQTEIRQVTKAQWYCRFDRNSKYFHALIRAERRRAGVPTLMNDQNMLISAPEDIAQAFISFYKRILGEELPRSLHVDSTIMLEMPYTRREIELALVEMNDDRSPGPDAFTALFFQKCWPIIGHENRRSGHSITHCLDNLSILVRRRRNKIGSISKDRAITTKARTGRIDLEDNL